MKRQTIRMLHLTLVLILLLGMTGCGSANTNDPTGDESSLSSSQSEIDKNQAASLTAYEKTFSKGPIPALNQDGLWGYINITGAYVIEPQFADAKRFTDDGLALVCDAENGLYGYIGDAGTYAIEPQFEEANSFSDGLAVVKDGEQYGYINVSGELAIRRKFKKAYNFSEGLAAVLDTLETPIYTFEGYGPMTTGYGFINKAGEYVIKPTYADVCSFSNGVSFVTYWNDKPVSIGSNPVHAINMKGEELSEEIFTLSSYRSASDGNQKTVTWDDGLYKLKPVDQKGNNYVYMDADGAIIRPEDSTCYIDSSDFRSGLAAAFDTSSGLWGYINTSGEWEIEPQYFYASPFSADGRAVIGHDSSERYSLEGMDMGPMFSPQVIDTSGNIVGAFLGRDMCVFPYASSASWITDSMGITIADYAKPLRSNLYDAYKYEGDYMNAIKNGGAIETKFGFVDLDGNTVIDFQFDEVGSFATDGSYAKVKINGLYGIINDKGEWLISPEFKAIG